MGRQVNRNLFYFSFFLFAPFSGKVSLPRPAVNCTWLLWFYVCEHCARGKAKAPAKNIQMFNHVHCYGNAHRNASSSILNGRRWWERSYSFRMICYESLSVFYCSWSWGVVGKGKGILFLLLHKNQESIQLPNGYAVVGKLMKINWTSIDILFPMYLYYLLH